MSELTMKNSTKQELFDAYTAMKKKMDELAAAKDDPIAEKERLRKDGVIKSAQDMIDKNVFAPEIIAQYKDICEAVEMKKVELNDLYGIEAEANSIVALINTHKDKEQELKEKYKILTDEAIANFEIAKAKIRDEIEALNIRKEDILASTEQEHKALMKEFEKKRARDEEEYEYNLRRNRKVANDKWEDEKNSREKELAEKEAEMRKVEAELAAREEKMEELEMKVSQISELVEAAREEGIKKGKADEQKSNAFEVRAINQKNEYEQQSLKDRIARLEDDLSATRAKNETLQEKLDEAYKQMRDLASETVKSANGVKIIDRENVSGK